MDLIHEIDKLITDSERRSEELNDRRDHGCLDGLTEARALAVAYIKHRQKADAETATDLQHAERENRRLREENERLKGAS